MGGIYSKKIGSNYRRIGPQTAPANRTLHLSAYLEILDLYVERGTRCAEVHVSRQVARAARGKTDIEHPKPGATNKL